MCWKNYFFVRHFATLILRSVRTGHEALFEKEWNKKFNSMVKQGLKPLQQEKGH